MKIDFDEYFSLSASDAYSYFETPRDWTRLYGLMGEVADLGGGWYSVPLKRFPFPLVARNTFVDPGRLVRWTFRGFWRGRAEIRFTDTDNGVRVDGFEEISVRYLGLLSPVVEKLLLERTFRGIWRSGWRRLRRQAERRADGARGENCGGGGLTDERRRAEQRWSDQADGPDSRQSVIDGTGLDQRYGCWQELDGFTILSVGPDQELGTEDDITSSFRSSQADGQS